MVNYNNNFESFSREEIGVKGPYFNLPNIQKQTVNTADSFCFSPFGMVSNIDCPEWDPACNCVVTQFRPKEPEPTEAELVQLREKFNECSLIQKEFPEKNDDIFLWLGVDYSNPRSSYNCPACNDYLNPENSQSRKANIKHFKPTQTDNLYELTQTNKLEPINVNYTEIDPNYNPDGKSIVYPYSEALSGICSGIVGICLSKGAINKPQTYDSTVPYKFVGDCFPFYLEYSKTNATFWNTPAEAPLLRQAQMSLLTYNRLKFMANGNYDLKPGNLVYIDYKTGESQGVQQKRYAGYWMVYKIERILTGTKHSMIVYVMRDGFEEDFATTPDTEKG